MDRLDSSGSDLDLDIDLESGGTSEEDASKGHALRGENLKNMTGRINNEFLRVESPHGSTNSSDCSCSYEKLLNSDGISIKNKETQLGKFREEMVNFVDKTMGRSKKQTSAKPPKPPRPPRGPSLDASDMKLLKEISELNLKRKRMERIRTLRKMKKEKASSLTSNLFALLVTIIFLLVIVFQDFTRRNHNLIFNIYSGVVNCAICGWHIDLPPGFTLVMPIVLPHQFPKNELSRHKLNASHEVTYSADCGRLLFGGQIGPPFLSQSFIDQVA